MADSVEPDYIPRLYALRPNGVAAYADGKYAWDPDVGRLFPNHWRICVTGDLAMAEHARVLDVEKFDATPADVKPYQLARFKHGFDTIVYCSRDTVRLVADANDEWTELEWWIATLDDNYWNPDSLTNYIRSIGGPLLMPAKIRAIQWAGRGNYDESSVWGNPHWSEYPH